MRLNKKISEVVEKIIQKVGFRTGEGMARAGRHRQAGPRDSSSLASERHGHARKIPSDGTKSAKPLDP